MTALCLAGGGAAVKLAAAAFTLVWIHTIEKVPWEEDWRVEPGHLVLDTVRLKGSGAGMEPAPEARLENGFYTWHPHAPRPEIVLRRADAAQVGDWTLCAAECRPLAAWLTPNADPVTIRPCDE